MASLIAEPDADVLTQIHAAQVNASDLKSVLGRDLTPQEGQLLEDFEQSWRNFVASKRGKLPSGRREVHIKYLQAKVEELTKTRDNVEVELNKQLAFFEQSKSTLEDEIRAKIDHENEEYEQIKSKLQKRLQMVEEAQQLQEETLPWSFFLSCVDAAASEHLDHDDLAKSRTVKPSQRAMYLTYQSPEEPEGMLRRAFQIDHAILKTQLKMLNKDIQRYEKTVATQEQASLFLMENNVWSILDKK